MSETREHREKAVEAGVAEAHRQLGADQLEDAMDLVVVRQRVDAVIQAAEPHLERMYFERFKEAVLTLPRYRPMNGAVGAPEHRARMILDKEGGRYFNCEQLQAALSKAQQLMEEGG